MSNHAPATLPPPRVNLVIPTLRRYDLLRNAVASACAGILPPTHITIIDNGAHLPPHIEQHIHRAAEGAELAIVRPGHNLGVAASWNLALHQLDDWIIISNDDVTFYHATIAALVNAAQADPDGLFFFPGSGGYKNAWSLYLQRKRSLAVVGYYDEQISPNYGFYEDNDYSYRLQLAGHRHIPVAGCAYSHVDSATVKSMTTHEMQEHWTRFNAAKQRYIAKWGGEPGHERHRTPFNGARPDYRPSIYG